MKSILKIGMAIAVVAVSLQTGLLSTAWAATPGDAILFSTSATDPNAGSTVNFTGSGQTGTLYIWVTSAGGTNDATNDAITPISTAYSGNIAAGASALNLSGALTGVSNSNFTSVNFDNPALTGSNGATRWSALSNYTTPAAGTNFTTSTFTNFEANAVLPNMPNAITAGTHMGLSTSNTAIDPLYFPAAVVANGSTPGAWKVGQVNFTSTATPGASTLTLSAGSLGVTKSQTGATTDMTSFYSYGSATINLGGGGRLGDLNADSAINNLDIDILGSDVRSGLTYAQAQALGRNDNLLANPNQNALVSQADMDHEVGSLVDIGGGGAGGSHGTHYGDANLDGVVNQLDLNAVSQNFLKTGQGWATGNFNGTVDTVVNQLDLNFVSQNFLKTGGTGQIAQVPEPATCVLFAFGGLAMLCAVRRRRS